MQRTLFTRLFIVESSPPEDLLPRSRRKRAGGRRTARPPCGGHDGTDLGLTYTQRTSRGGALKRRPRDSGTQYAATHWGTVSWMKTTAGDSERGHKAGAACLQLLWWSCVQTRICL
ncbi:hypothetical protein DPMN_020256 [Dreissena polymorpha]|uniref:Uncharacterized protein n=1 Tax=Dreissena polymorpha TaxID=45954 RepID=A0A9D4SA17_DREPO|nr:hypothetical protein DPMN_020256 [Dreissena polymorpha]